VTKRINSALRAARAWALIGGPPCQAYSLVGRSRMQSTTNPDFEKDHRHLLYREYLRIVARHQPPVFLMENVEGLLSATHSGERIFHRILSDLHEPGKALAMHGRARLRYRLYAVGKAAQSSLIAGADSIPDPGSLLVQSEDYGIPQARHRVFVVGIRDAPTPRKPTAPIERLAGICAAFRFTPHHGTAAYRATVRGKPLRNGYDSRPHLAAGICHEF